MRKEAVDCILERNPNAFRPKIESNDFKHIKGMCRHPPQQHFDFMICFRYPLGELCTPSCRLLQWPWLLLWLAIACLCCAPVCQAICLFVLCSKNIILFRIVCLFVGAILPMCGFAVCTCRGVMSASACFFLLDGLFSTSSGHGDCCGQGVIARSQAATRSTISKPWHAGARCCLVVLPLPPAPTTPPWYVNVRSADCVRRLGQATYGFTT